MSFNLSSISNIANSTSSTVATSISSIVGGKQSTSSKVSTASKNTSNSTSKASSTSGSKSIDNLDNKNLSDASLSKWNIIGIPNALNDYRNVTYHFQLSLMSEVQKSTDLSNASRVVIAESGATEILIESVESSVSLVPNFRTKNTAWHSFVIKLYEPMAADLYDKMAVASKALNIKNLPNSRYNLKLYFIGEDPITGVQQKIGEEWNWPLIIINIDTKMTVAGCYHTLTCTTDSSLGATDTYLRTPVSLTLSGKTLGDYLNSLASQLNQFYSESYLCDMITYEFKGLNYPSESGTNISTPLDHIVDHTDSTDSVTLNPNKATVPDNSLINGIIDSLLSNSTTAAVMINPGRQEDGSYVPPSDKKANSYHVMVKSDVELTGYNSFWNDYTRKITFTLVPYNTTRLLGNFQDTTEINNADYANKRASYMGKNNMIQKVYDYIFTGDNTEVLDFNIESNFSYCAIVNYAFGTVSDQAEITGKIASYNSDGSKTQDFKNTINSKVAAGASSLSTLVKNKATAVSNLDKAANSSSLTSLISSGSSLLDAVEKQYTTISNITNSSVGSSIGNRIPLSEKQSGNISYIDNVDLSNFDASSMVNQVTPVSAKTRPLDSEGNIDFIIDSDPSNKRSMFVGMLEQLYDGTNLISLNMTVRGDPYWLGASYYGTKYNDITSADISSTSSSDRTFNCQYPYHKDTGLVLRFKSPVGNDYTSSSKFKNSYFSGLYYISEITHIFSNGEYKQILQGGLTAGLQMATLNQTSSSNSTTSNKTASNTKSNLYVDSGTV